jgi:four helix bundle protein
MTNFRNLKIWQKGVEIVIQVYHLSGKLPDVEKFGLRSQLTRAAVSIPSNIAEGSSRTSQKDFARFLEISLGSTFELETQLLIIQELKLIETEVLGNLLENLNEEQKMIMGYIKKLNT